MRARYSILTDESVERRSELVEHFYPTAKRADVRDSESVWRIGNEVVAINCSTEEAFELTIMVDSAIKLHNILVVMKFRVLEANRKIVPKIIKEI